MKAATSNEIKNELKELAPGRLIELCLRLVRYKKENKELISFLLFNADDIPAYMEGVKQEMNDSFSEINTNNAYYIKKSLRKILRFTNRYIKYTGQKYVEVELLLYFCSRIKEEKIRIDKSTALSNLYKGQLKKIEEGIASLHEDLQHDYNSLLQNLK